MSHFKKVLASAAVFVLFFAFSFVFAYAEGGKIAVVSGDQVNLRESPNTSSTVITRLSEGTQCEIAETADGWYKVTVGDSTGWISAQFVTVNDSSSLAGIVNGDNVNVRSDSGTWSDVVARLNFGDRVAIIGRSDDWYNVQMSDGATGWIRKDFISFNVSRGEEIGRQIASFARRYIGTPYVYGGSYPGGFDCSGFVKYVYSNFGIYLERVAADQARQGSKVSIDSLRVGDLVFFSTEGAGYINHAGIYIGNGSFIHASSGAHCVTINGLGGYYSNTYVTARRIIR